MTEEQFVDKLKQLLRETESSGFDMDKACALAEYILENGDWEDKDDHHRT
jgi:hypothetical protein